MSNHRYLTTLRTSAIALAVGAALLSTNAALADDRKVAFDIPAESTASALNDLANQANIHLIFPYDIAARTTAPAVKGTYSVDEALRQLLAGSGLEIASDIDGTISLREAGTKTEPAAEIIVTGTHLRGINPTSPLHTVDRKDIERSGYSDVGQIIRSLPENFSGGQNPGVVAASSGNIANHNDSNAATVNLRGLGTDATLVLVNGHRLSSDSFSQGSDISGVPLAAVQRIEIVPDGASALYGSDAVAGVVNFILRKNFNGTELSARYGARTDGGGEDQLYSVLTGVSGSNWYAMLNWEHEEQNAVTGQQAGLDTYLPTETIIRPQDRNSVFVSLGRDLTNAVSISFDGLYSDRYNTADSQPFSTWDFYQSTTYTPAYSVAANLDFHLGGGWKAHVTGVASGSLDNEWSLYPDYDWSYAITYKNYLQYAEATADGTLFTLPSGDVKLAVGGGYRHEGFMSGRPGTSDAYEGTRDVAYAYAETQIPVVAASETRTGLHSLDLSLSGRTEHYSDFGSTTNPRVGIRYVPLNDLAIRASWGKSFKAPSFLQSHLQSTLYLWDAASVGGAAGGTALMTWGGNPDLKPEKSTSWTLGADYTPASLPALKLSATYFDIDYVDRVVQPVTLFSTGLSNPIYAPFVDQNPSAEYQAELMANAAIFYNYSSGAYDPSQVVAVIRDTFQNATSQTIKGLDVSYRQSFDVGESTISGFLNGTWARLEQQTISTMPVVRLSGTVFNTPKFKARGGLTWQRAAVTLTGIVNYLSDEVDTGVLPYAKVGSWTTLDATGAYVFANGSGFTHGLKLSLSISNLLDQRPPEIYSSQSHLPGINFDSTNTSIMGRYASLTVTKAW
ncbi:MAG: TonB-dependent receptor [Asticcacaulis sp.]|uniref:TonB-dependent receptor domain-containing protein n=1 Tax=Asticcacaulis sp. TaxID=1872648 RepID=UPI0039E276B5